MSKRQPPYRHTSDGSNCWTANCSRGNTSTASPATKPDWKAILQEQIQNSIDTMPSEAERKANQFKQTKDDIDSVLAGPVPLDVIASKEEFEAAVANKEIMRGRHPEFPYSIYKYSQQTTYERNWNKITTACRGLIVNDETGEILARPFPKFFNYSEDKTPLEDMTGPMVVAEKLDGSLGISYMAPDGLRISTAGGLSSEQAEHATALYREKYEGNWEPRKGVTYMWEIIYPQNRIVVDYGDEDDIYLLGAVKIRTGKSIPLSELKEWKWKRATEHSNFDSLEAVVGAPERSNHEGYIVHFLKSDARVKMKHDEYLQNHKYATGINSRRIWEMMRDNEDIGTWTMNAPEEFEEYISSTKADIQKKFNSHKSKILSSYEKFVAELPKDLDQKGFAQAVKAKAPKEMSGYFFTLRAYGSLDNPKTIKSLWEKVKPDFEKSFWSANSGVKE